MPYKTRYVNKYWFAFRCRYTNERWIGLRFAREVAQLQLVQNKYVGRFCASIIYPGHTITVDRYLFTDEDMETPCYRPVLLSFSGASSWRLIQRSCYLSSTPISHFPLG